VSATTVSPDAEELARRRYLEDQGWPRLRRAVRHFMRRRPLGAMGAVIIVVMIFAAAFADIIDVRPVAGLGVLSLADAKEHLNKISPVSDEELRLMLPAAVERVERHTGRALSGATQVTASEVLAVKLVLAEYWRTQRAKVGRGVSGGGASGVAIESDSGLGGMAAIKTRLTDLLGPPAAEAGAAPVGSFPAAQPWPDPAGCWSRSVW